MVSYTRRKLLILEGTARAYRDRIGSLENELDELQDRVEFLSRKVARQEQISKETLNGVSCLAEGVDLLLDTVFSAQPSHEILRGKQ